MIGLPIQTYQATHCCSNQLRELKSVNPGYSSVSALGTVPLKAIASRWLMVVVKCWRSQPSEKSRRGFYGYLPKVMERAKDKKITSARTTPQFGKFQMWSDISGQPARDSNVFLPRVDSVEAPKDLGAVARRYPNNKYQYLWAKQGRVYRICSNSVVFEPYPWRQFQPFRALVSSNHTPMTISAQADFDHDVQCPLEGQPRVLSQPQI